MSTGHTQCSTSQYITIGGTILKESDDLYKLEIIVPTSLHGAEAWGMISADRRKVNVLEMKCLRSLVGVSRLDRVKNGEVHNRAGIEKELASRADQRELRWFGHVERIY